MASDVLEKKKHNSGRLGCEHFIKECSIERGEKNIMTGAGPTVSTEDQDYSWVEKQDLSRLQTKELVKRRSTKDPQLAVSDWEALNQKVLSLTLEIICLLTGEDYIVVKKTSNQHLTLSPTKKPSSLIHEKNNAQKILDLTNKITELLTGEVPINYQDLSVHLSIEEKMDIEGHKYLYEDMENHQNLISSGGPHHETSSHIWESCPDKEKLHTDFSSILNHFNGGQFRNEFHDPVRNITKDSCDDGSIQGDADQAQHPSLYIKEGQEEFEYTKISENEDLCSADEGITGCTSSRTSTSVAQPPDTLVKEEPVSCDGRQFIDHSYMPTDHTCHRTTQMKRETFSCDEGPFIDYNVNTATVNTQQCPTTRIKEGLAFSDVVNITDPNSDALIGRTLHPPTLEEEPDPCDGENMTDPSFNLPTNCSSNIKEPVLWDGGQFIYNSCVPTDHTYHMTTQIKKGSFSCDMGHFQDYNSNTAMDNTQWCPTTHIKEGLVLFDGVNLTDPNNDTPIDHTQHHPTIKKEPDSCNRETITDLYCNMPTNCSPLINEPVSWDGGQFIVNSNMPTDHTYHMTTQIKMERLSCAMGQFMNCNGNTTMDDAQECPTTHITNQQASLDGENITDPTNDTPIDHTLHLPAIKEEPDLCENITDPCFNLPTNSSSHITEPVSWDGRQFIDNSYMPTDHTYHMTTQIKIERFSCDVTHFKDCNVNTATDNTHENGLASLDGVNVTDPNTPMEHTQHHPAIKEEPDSCDGENITDPSFNLPTDNLCPHIKEPASWDGGQLIDNSCMFKDHTYHTTTQIEMQSFLCDEEHFSIKTTTTNAQQWPTAHVKEELASLDGRNLTDPTSDIPIDHTQHHPTIKEEPDSCDEENITDPYCNLPTNCSSHIKEEPVSQNEGNLTDPNIYTPPNHTQQYQSTPVKEEPDSCDISEMEQNTVSIKEEKNDVLDNDLQNTFRSPAQQCPSTCVRDETTVKHSSSISQIGEKPNSSFLVRSVELAHLLEMAPKKQANTNCTRTNSQGPPCAAGTSTGMHDLWESRPKHLSFKNNPEKTFGNVSNFTKYLGANSSKKNPKCSQREWYFLRRPQCEPHIRINAEQNLFECENCGKYFLNSDQLIEHQTMFNGSFGCSVCVKSFDKAPSLVNHQWVCDEEKPFQCVDCGKCFRIFNEFYLHKKTCIKEKKCQCSKCGKSYKSKVRFDLHMRTHTGKRPFGCTGCWRRFTDRKMLFAHQMLHTGLKLYGCPECGKRFSERLKLIIHRRIHTGRKPVVCFQCGKSFVTRSSLIRHKETHSYLRLSSFVNPEEHQQTEKVASLYPSTAGKDLL